MRIPIAKTLSVLAILGIFGVIAGITAVIAQDDTDPRIPDEIRNYVPPTPEPAFTKEELREIVDASRATRKNHIPIIQGTPLNMPSDAKFDGLFATVQQLPIPGPEGDIHPPLQTPIYLIIRDGEVAAISQTTGHFSIGEKHKDTFRFLIDQLDESKMQLIDDEFYEKRWGHHRQDALDEGGN